MSSPDIRARGRPKDEAKHRAIRQAAARLFMRQGFHATSMDAIAQAAMVSKLTIYGHYAGKDDLFRAMILERCNAFGIIDALDLGMKAPVAPTLARAGEAFLELVLDREVRALERLVIAEAQAHPKIAELFFEAGPQRIVTRLADYLAAKAASGELTLEAPVLAAEQFLSSLKGLPHLRALLGLRARRPVAEEIAEQVGHAVAAFMRAHGPRKGEPLSVPPRPRRARKGGCAG